MIELLPRRALFASIIAIGLSSSVFAAPPVATGLGQAWPNVTDVSASTHWHVYVFVRDGIEYIQVNDLNGNVRGAVASSNGTFLVLPMGMDAAKFSIPQAQRDTPSVDCHDPVECNTHRQNAGTLAYQDNSVMVYAIPQSDGSVRLNAVGVDCHDPVECNTHRQNPTAGILLLNDSKPGNTPAVDCHDPVECNTHRQVINSIKSTPATQSLGPVSGGVAVDCHDPVECNTH